MTTAALRSEQMCNYDLDDLDTRWLNIVNGERALMGKHHKFILGTCQSTAIHQFSLARSLFSNQGTDKPSGPLRYTSESSIFLRKLCYWLCLIYSMIKCKEIRLNSKQLWIKLAFHKCVWKLQVSILKGLRGFCVWIFFSFIRFLKFIKLW